MVTMKDVKAKKLVFLVILLAIIWCKDTVSAKLVAYWNFDEGSGTTAKDSTGNDNTGTLYNMTNDSWVPGKMGTALKFDGKDDYIIVKDSAEIEFGESSFSIVFWMKKTYVTSGPTGVILLNGTSGGEFQGATGKRYEITDFNNGRLIFAIDDDLGKSVCISPEVFSTGDWVHVAMVRESKSNQLLIYADTLLVVSVVPENNTGNIDSVDEPLIIGAQQKEDNTPNTFCDFFYGMLDELRFFDHALTGDEIKNLYETGETSKKTLTSELVRNKLSEVEKLIDSQKYKEAITLVEKEVLELKQRAQQNPQEASEITKWLPDLYFNLAVACERTGAPQKDTITAYKNAVFSNRNEWKALIWLIDNSPQSEYEPLIKEFLQSPDEFSSACKKLCRYFMTNKDWLTFVPFLDVVSGVSEGSTTVAESIYKYLNDNWREKYLEYCKAKPQLANFVAKKRSESHFEICDKLFQNGSYEKAIQEFDKFLVGNKSIDREKSLQAILKKGQCYIHLGEIDKASREFLTFVTEYPDSEQSPEAAFYIGYCNMLQAKFELAREAFNLVIKDYPKSSFANKAKLCLERIESMTEQK